MIIDLVSDGNIDIATDWCEQYSLFLIYEVEYGMTLVKRSMDYSSYITSGYIYEPDPNKNKMVFSKSGTKHSSFSFGDSRAYYDEF